MSWPLTWIGVALAAFAFVTTVRRLAVLEPYLLRKPLGCDPCMSVWSAAAGALVHLGFLARHASSWRAGLDVLLQFPADAGPAAALCLFLLAAYERLLPGGPPRMYATLPPSEASGQVEEDEDA